VSGGALNEITAALHTDIANKKLYSLLLQAKTSVTMKAVFCVVSYFSTGQKLPFLHTRTCIWLCRWGVIPLKFRRDLLHHKTRVPNDAEQTVMV